MSQHTLTNGLLLTKKEQKNQDKEFVDSILSIFRPKLVMPNYEDVQIPEELRFQIIIERMKLAIAGDKLASETETLWYLSTASLVAPFDHHWYNIFMYLSRKYRLSANKELPDFLRENIILDEYTEERELYRLRKWIYDKGMKALK